MPVVPGRPVPYGHCEPEGVPRFMQRRGALLTEGCGGDAANPTGPGTETDRCVLRVPDPVREEPEVAVGAAADDRRADGRVAVVESVGDVDGDPVGADGRLAGLGVDAVNAAGLPEGDGERGVRDRAGTAWTVPRVGDGMGGGG